MSLELDTAWERQLWEEASRQLPELRPDSSGIAWVARSLQALSEGLTRKRPLIGQTYLDHAESLVPYLVYFLPANAYRTRWVLQRSQLAQKLADKTTLRIDELGCGPGTQLIGVIQALTLIRPQAETPLQIFYRGTDWSSRALQSFERLIRRAQDSALIPGWIQIQLELIHQPASHWRPVRCELLLLGNVLNELDNLANTSPSSTLHALWDSLLHSPVEGGWLLLIEPALQSSSWRVSQLRELAVACGDLRLLSPCTHRQKCPLADDGRPAAQWCHQELRWERPPNLEALDLRTGLNKQHFSLTHLLLERGAEDAPAADGEWQHFRVMSPPLSSKGLQTVHLCGEAGFQEAVRLTRAIRAENESFGEVQRGDRMSIRQASRRGERLRIEATTEVQRQER